VSFICGVFNRTGKPVTAEVIAPMLTAATAWGKDGSGTWCEGEVGLGHRLRRDTPESAEECLPATSSCGNLVITCTARLDNRHDLAAELELPRPRYRHLPDSDLILRAFQRWGDDCPLRLLGDWAFAVWDKRRHRLFIARDHHGSSGVFFFCTRQRFAFASSLASLLSLPDCPREVNHLRVAQVLVAWPGDGRQTAFQEVERLPPAHRMTVTGDQVRQSRYWFPESTPELRLGSDDDYVDAFLDLFTEAVACRLRSNRSVGVMLSGGLDSGSIAAVAARLLQRTGQELPAFCSVPMYNVAGILPPSRIGDESPLAGALAQHAGNISLYQIRAQKISPVAGLRWALELLKEPLHAAPNLYWLQAILEAARSHNVDAMLTGLGGNATISWHAEGYLRMLVAGRQWRRALTEARALSRTRRTHLLRVIARQLIAPWMAQSPLRGLLHRYQALRSGNTAHTGPPWLAYSAINPDLSRRLELDARMAEDGHDPRFNIPHDQRQIRLTIIRPGREIVGSIWEGLGAGADLQLRDPAYDRRIIELCLAIPDDQYFHKGHDRWLIRRAMQGYLPACNLGEQRHGLQSADLGQRLHACKAEVWDLLNELSHSEAACSILDLGRMRRVARTLDSQVAAGQRVDYEQVLMRGLGVGLFLLEHL
jgi:asparagine synthase (glutamine-hydrolysing)